LALVAAQTKGTVFQAQDYYEPALLYAGWAHQLRGDRVAAQKAFRGALALLDPALRDIPEDARLHGARGLALAGLGSRADARREAERVAVGQSFGVEGPRREYSAMIFANTGAVKEALGEIEALLSGPSRTSVHNLRIDPRWNPIRNEPRFQTLLVKYAEPKPIR
jgi:serine/threonine-protein kinase